MSLGQLPPVGTPLLTGISDISSEIPQLGFKGFKHTLLGSGTAALALALSQIVKYSNSANRNVVIPGYACPDLVSACEYAGTQAVIVDFDPHSYQYDLTQIEHLSGTLLAVICPALLGISMPIKSLRDVLPQDTYIIEDNAQWFPEHEDKVIQQHNLKQLDQYELPVNTQQSDFFITSFGRGKPVNLMGGGLLAWQHQFNDWFADYQGNGFEAKSASLSYKLRLKAHLFNLVCHPLPYGLLTRIPAMKLGTTEYHRLTSIELMDNEKAGINHIAIHQYLSQPQNICEVLKKNIPHAWPEQAVNKRLLRLPLLASNKRVRDTIVRECNILGLGASVMYEKPLIAINNVPDKVNKSFATPIANKAADGFFTLPVHPGVSFKHAEKMINVLTPYFNALHKVPV